MPFVYATSIMMMRTALLALCGASLVAPAFAQPGPPPGGPPGGPPSIRHRTDQDAARRALLDGSVMPFSVLKRRVEGRVAEYIGPDAYYLGPEFLPDSNGYRLKYMRDRRVVWVDVDGRTGEILAWSR